MDLRPYQQVAVDAIREHYLKGTKKVLLHLSTGGGKTVVFSYILKAMLERGKTGLMVVRGRHLVDQASDRLTREGVPHGILMNGRQAEDGHALHVCSIDTLRARGLRPKADLIVIDEAHMAISPSYIEFLLDYPSAYILGVTATPYMTKSIRHIADVVVMPISISDLVAQGFLVAPRYIVPVEMNLKDVRINNGEYDSTQISDLMGTQKVIGDIVEHWLRFAESRPTVCFSSSCENSQAIVNSLRAAGITAEHIEASTPDEERAAVLSRLQSGETKIVSNVGILCTGVDLPHVSCILMARPTKSLNLYIQQAGRGTRPHATKRDFIILDHANNVKEHGFIHEDHEVFLEGRPKKAAGAPPIKTCPTCFAALPTSASICEYCGHVFTPKKKDETEDGELREIDVNDPEFKILSFIKEKRRVQAARKYKPGWVFHQVKEMFGEEAAKRYVPGRGPMPDWVRQKITRDS